ncbi:MAG TPA: tail fiber domain-containing protein, partial [Polyangia bacterium]|nr:tail fiber domain-containing protein [Polyangia bacterium]
GQAPATGDGIGVKGIGPNTYGVWGVSTTGAGVFGQSTSGAAVNASSQSGYGVSAASQSGIGVYATTTTGGNPAVKGVGAVTGLHGIGSVQGVFGQATALTTTAYGISGTSQSGSGVFGWSYDGAGVTGQTDFGAGVKAIGSSLGLLATATGTGTAVRGENSNTNGWAGYFVGKVYSTENFYTQSWQSSDARLKKDVAVSPYGLKDLAALRPVTFKWKDAERPGGRQVGFIAQEIQTVVPEVVTKEAQSGMLSVNYSGLVPVLVKSIQEQQAIIARQDDRMAQQDARIAALEQRPVLSSMFSGGVNVSVAIGAFAALALSVIRARKQRAQAPVRPV